MLSESCSMSALLMTRVHYPATDLTLVTAY
jgi:hypothetical protein